MLIKSKFGNEFAVDGHIGASASKPFAENSPSRQSLHWKQVYRAVKGFINLWLKEL